MTGPGALTATAFVLLVLSVIFACLADAASWKNRAFRSRLAMTFLLLSASGFIGAAWWAAR